MEEGGRVYRIMKGGQKSNRPFLHLTQDRSRLALAVPFLWEQSPGTPKHCKTIPVANHGDAGRYVNRNSIHKDTNSYAYHGADTADDGDDESTSMVTAEGLTCRASIYDDSSDDEDGGALKRSGDKAKEEEKEEEACIDFIMSRFLPAAQAMATSESPNKPMPETYSCHRLSDTLIKPSPRSCPTPLIQSVSLQSGRLNSTSTTLQTDDGNNDYHIDACPAMPIKLCGLFPPRRIHRILLRFNRLFTLRPFLTHRKKIKMMIMKTKTKTKTNCTNTKTKMNTKTKTETTTKMTMTKTTEKKKKGSTPHAPRSLLEVIDNDDDDDTDNDLSDTDVDEDMMVMRQVQAISQRRRAQTLLVLANSPYLESPLDQSQSQSQSQSFNYQTSSRTPSYNSCGYSDDPYNNRLVDCYYDASDRFSRPQTPSLALTPFRNARGSPNSPFKNIKGFLGMPNINNYVATPKAYNINATCNLSESNGSAMTLRNSNHNSLEERYRSLQLRKLADRPCKNCEENLDGNDDLGQDSRVWPLEIISSSKMDSPVTATSTTLPLPLPKSPSDPWLWKTIPYSRAIANPLSASASTSPSCSKRMSYDRIASGRFLPLVSKKDEKPSTHSTSFEVI